MPALPLLSRGAAFWAVAFAFLAVTAFSTAPSSLYGLIERRDALAPLTTTIVYAVYAVGVVVSLLLVGHVSDWYGRRTVLIPALAVAVVAGAVVREGPVAPVYIGEVLAHQTLLWVGETFGVAFYRVGSLSGAMIFDAERAGMNDRVDLPPLRGQLLDATCVFSDDRCWFLAQTQEGGGTVNNCYLVMRDGAVIASHRARDGDGGWLGTLQGKCAVGAALLAPTDAGVVRLEAEGNSIRESKTFPETEQYVSSASQLLAGRDGLYVVQAHEIQLLTISR
jgi:hypothetical protein